MKFSIGYNQRPDFFDLLEAHADKISSVYFPLPEDVSGSGRAVPQGPKFRAEISLLVRACARLGVGSVAAVNATCEGAAAGTPEQLRTILSELARLSADGLTAASFANLLYVPAAKKALPKLEIWSSVNCYVREPQQARLMGKLGVDVLTADREVNRDLAGLAALRKTSGAKIQVLLNEGCLAHCPFRHAHYNLLAHCHDEGALEGANLIEGGGCTRLLAQDPSLILKIPFVRPEDLPRYAGVADVFKLSTRTLGTAEIEKTLLAYWRGRHDGNLLEILDMGVYAYGSVVRSVDNRKLGKLGFFDVATACRDCPGCPTCAALMAAVERA